MIRDKLIPLLKQKFGDNTFSEGPPSNLIAIFPAAHADVGPLSIFDDGPEVIVEIGEITHGHFGSFDPDLSVNEAEQEVAGMVLNFLDDLFAGNYILWRSEGGAGGWLGIDHLETSDPVFDPPENALLFTWAGPFYRR